MQRLTHPALRAPLRGEEGSGWGHPCIPNGHKLRAPLRGGEGSGSGCLEATIAENLERAETLCQSILKRAFAGKRVPQGPNDEPASVLLE
ncbi:hypothetical protein OOK60_05455 [Trichothermofontia sichuanensis B231]|uniref:hypothetical protein n=1 Tax=Trichothermofontia sichuanensis TaxID=3045816 RepID=UPI002246179F|nr:hypothetical protein OOK60_05455 [Trichothermofontia sichuanensis B231]